MRFLIEHVYCMTWIWTLHRAHNKSKSPFEEDNIWATTIIVFTYRVPVFFYKIFLPAALILKNETDVSVSKLPPLNCLKLEANQLLESV